VVQIVPTPAPTEFPFQLLRPNRPSINRRPHRKRRLRKPRSLRRRKRSRRELKRQRRRRRQIRLLLRKLRVRGTSNSGTAVDPGFAVSPRPASAQSADTNVSGRHHD
jgi:hypothetical protein